MPNVLRNCLAALHTALGTFPGPARGSRCSASCHGVAFVFSDRRPSRHKVMPPVCTCVCQVVGGVEHLVMYRLAIGLSSL